MRSQIISLIDQLRNLQDGPLWIGTNFHKKLEHLSEDQFFFNAPERHSIGELIAHLTVWRSETILKIKTGKGSITDSDASNWTQNDILRRKGRDKLMDEYNSSLIQLIELLNKKDDSFLDDMYYDTDFRGNYPYSFVVRGMIHHDLYHLGQIGLLIKLLPPETS